MKRNNYKPEDEWFKQADYDLKTAEAMLKTKRYIYTVFMCHLSIEKALKGLYAKKFKTNPPKIHPELLRDFCEKIKLELNPEQQDFVDKLNTLSVPTRYPYELEKLLKDYKKDATNSIFNKTKKLLICLKNLL